MGFWLTDSIARKAPDKPFRKPTSKGLSLYGAAFAFFPVWLFLSLLSMSFAYYHLSAGPLQIWLFPVAWIGVGVACIRVWARHVPPIVSWVLAAAGWMITYWLAFCR